MAGLRFRLAGTQHVEACAAVARALAAKPKLLILGEPTEGIQPNIIKGIGRVIRMLADKGLDGQRAGA